MIFATCAAQSQVFQIIYFIRFLKRNANKLLDLLVLLWLRVELQLIFATCAAQSQVFQIIYFIRFLKRNANKLLVLIAMATSGATIAICYMCNTESGILNNLF